MRELKYRAWNGDSYIELNNLRGERSIYFSPYDLGAIPPEIRDKVALEQYTGIKDKNGKEIYEGDIVECSFGESGAVEFRHGAYCVVGDDINDMSNWKETAFEVIGNIHENPELLEQEDA